MSNHSGSYMLNSMLARLERESYFKMSDELHDGTCISVRSTSIRHGYHGYRLEDEDDMRSLVLKEWKRRGQRADD